MPRRKTVNVVRITVSMPSELASFIEAQAKVLSLDTSSVVRMLLLRVKQEEEERKHVE